MSETKSQESNFKPVEEWKTEKGTSNFHFAGAKALAKWANGREVTAVDYDKAVKAFSSIKIK